MDLYEVMAWLEASALAEALRGLGIWTYGILNLVHILGISTLFGAVLILDLRLLGLWQGIAMSTIMKITVPLAATGFAVAVTSGIMMFSFNTTEYHGNPFLYIKLPVIVVALINILVVQRLGAWQRAANDQPVKDRDSVVLPVVGAVSLIIWLTVITCGRLIGYW